VKEQHVQPMRDDDVRALSLKRLSAIQRSFQLEFNFTQSSPATLLYDLGFFSCKCFYQINCTTESLKEGLRKLTGMRRRRIIHLSWRHLPESSKYLLSGFDRGLILLLLPPSSRRAVCEGLSTRLRQQTSDQCKL
jgi:hypothetical protein